MLTAGVDVQGDRLEVSIWGWGKGEQSWLIDHHQIFGDPLENEVWQQLTHLIALEYQHESGNVIRTRATCVDSGYLTHDVYMQVRKRKHLHMFAIKGQAGAGKLFVNRPRSMEISYRGQVIERGIKLYVLGVDSGKETLYHRTKIETPGSKYINFPAGLDTNYFQGFCSEIQVKKHRAGQVYFANDVEIQENFLAWKAQPAIMQEHIEWSMWMCALRWLYKKRWNPKYKLANISSSKKERDSLEPFSDLLHSALLLCEQCYLHVDKFEYSHHLVWFHAVALELQRFGLTCPEGKEKFVIKLREAAKNLRDNQNPIDPSQYPALWQLMETSLTLTNSNLVQGFRNKYLTRTKPRMQRGNIYEVGFISAISSWANEIHTNPELCSMKSTSEEISLNTGRGKGLKTVSRKKLEKWVCRMQHQIRDCQS